MGSPGPRCASSRAPTPRRSARPRRTAWRAAWARRPPRRARTALWREPSGRVPLQQRTSARRPRAGTGRYPRGTACALQQGGGGEGRWQWRAAEGAAAGGPPLPRTEGESARVQRRPVVRLEAVEEVVLAEEAARGGEVVLALLARRDVGRLCVRVWGRACGLAVKEVGSSMSSSSGRHARCRACRRGGRRRRRAPCARSREAAGGRRVAARRGTQAGGRSPPALPPHRPTFAMDLIVVRSAGVIVSSAASDASRTGSATESSPAHSSRMALSRCASASTTTASAAMTPRASLTVGTRSSTARMSSAVSTCTGAERGGGGASSRGALKAK